MQIPFILLVSSALLILYVNLKIKRANRDYGAEYKTLLERERAANNTRRKEIPDSLFYKPNLPPIFAINNNPTPQMTVLREKLLNMSGRKMIHLGAMSNIDIKLNYGVTQLESVVLYEETFDNFMRALCNYAKEANDAGFTYEAAAALWVAVNAGFDESNPWLLLADIYTLAGDVEALERLYETARSLPNEDTKYKIMSKINDRCNELFDD